MKTWLYKDTIESGILVNIEDVPKYSKEGYVDSPDNYNKPGLEATSLQDMDKEELEIYAREVFNVELDRRKNHKNLVKEVKALEDGIK